MPLRQGVERTVLESDQAIDISNRFVAVGREHGHQGFGSRWAPSGRFGESLPGRSSRLENAVDRVGFGGSLDSIGEDLSGEAIPTRR
jgi:hypothetical protein